MKDSSGHAVRRRRFRRALCRAGAAGGGRAGARGAARSARGGVPEAAGRARPDAVRRGRRDASADIGRARGRRVGRGGQSGRRRSPTWTRCRSTARRNVARAAADAGAAALVHISAIGADPESPSRLRPDQGRGRGGGARGLPGRDDPAAVDGVRARGRVHQSLRRDDRQGAGACRCCAAARSSSRCMSKDRRRGGRRGAGRCRRRTPARRMSSAGPTCCRCARSTRCWPRRSAAVRRSSTCPTRSGALIAALGFLPGAPITRGPVEDARSATMSSPRTPTAWPRSASRRRRWPRCVGDWLVRYPPPRPLRQAPPTRLNAA